MSLSASLAPNVLDDAYESSHMLAMPLTLAPVHFDAGRPDLASRFDQQPYGCGYIVRGLSTVRYQNA